jgi:predicted component of type VI protein secretion system
MGTRCSKCCTKLTRCSNKCGVDIKGNTANAKFQGELGAEVPVVLAMARLGHFLSVIIVI